MSRELKLVFDLETSKSFCFLLVSTIQHNKVQVL